MCRKHNPRKIDSCMKDLIRGINAIKISRYDILACCCGHGKYPMSIVYRLKGIKYAHEMLSGCYIRRTKRFYRKDSEGYYYIPEALDYFKGDEE